MLGIRRGTTGVLQKWVSNQTVGASRTGRRHLKLTHFPFVIAIVPPTSFSPRPSIAVRGRDILVPDPRTLVLLNHDMPSDIPMLRIKHRNLPTSVIGFHFGLVLAFRKPLHVSHDSEYPPPSRKIANSQEVTCRQKHGRTTPRFKENTLVHFGLTTILTW